ncbi:T-cell immunoreceptor with Ig and ITIM domains precursor [Mus musculus]|uniref:T-cell immunoreceptor with Ig and ITIM domains n=1 Tax=Mus musculus TaxID=10090 RepID=A0A0B4J1G6_MOUSE|nr:T-cell immunoreceptor with Ig and ITIM domains precursor [Mus musculus]ACD74758.1 T cell immunoreceptor with Ig and ITIM domains [Mus musculus]|eukprot:NP_001139797.1 T-cell immunoreceptor with Ig and ITIM domains precursor [Mus musculus]
MHGWLLLVWVQGLIQAAFLATGATAGTIDTKRNISAEEGGSVILQCHFSSDTAEVTQVDWKQQDQLLAIYSVDLGWHVASVFSDRVVPGPSLGLTFQSLTMNDTGEYFCTYHTYPGGIYKGRIFLKVQESSVAQFQTAPLGGTMAAVLGLICLMVTGVTVLARKKSIRMHSIESGLGRTEAEPQEWNLRSLSSPGSPVQTQTAPAGPCGEQAEDDYADPQEYFNVLSYRSLESFIAVSKTG